MKASSLIIYCSVIIETFLIKSTRSIAINHSTLHSSNYWKSLRTICDGNGDDRIRKFAKSAWYYYVRQQEGTEDPLLTIPTTNKMTIDDYNNNHIGDENEQMPSSPSSSSVLVKGQKCDLPFPDLGAAQPFHEPPDWLREELGNKYRTIQQELIQYLNDGNNNNGKRIRPKSTETPSSSERITTSSSSSWSTSSTKLCQDTIGFTKLMLKDTDGKATDIGRLFFPNTLRLFDDNNTVVKNMIAPRPINIHCQKPQTGLAPHSDNMNFLLTCHVGLILPKDGICSFQNHDEIYHWTEGGIVVADTSFVHSTYNSSPTTNRFVFSFSIWHPSLTMKERKAILLIHDLLTK